MARTNTRSKPTISPALAERFFALGHLYPWSDLQTATGNAVALLEADAAKMSLTRPGGHPR